MSHTRDDVLRFIIGTAVIVPRPIPAPDRQRVVVDLPVSEANRYTVESLLQELIDKGFDVALAENGGRYRLSASRDRQ